MDLLPADRAEAIRRIQQWRPLVDSPTAWERVLPSSRSNAVRERVAAIAESLARRRVDSLYLLADDPWQDAGLAARMIDAVTGLLRRLPDEHRPSPEENALLLLAPLLYDTLWSGVAASYRGLAPHDLTPSQDASSDRAAFERFTLSFSQPRRRAIEAVRQGRWDAAEEIGWWLLHRWISRRPEAYRPEAIAELLGASHNGGDDHTRLAELLRAMRADPGFLSRSDRQGSLVSMGSDGVRERLLGYLLTMARAMAVETSALGEVIGEHLGITDPVTATDLASVVDAGEHWRISGSAFLFEAACRHPAVEVALRSHLEEFNQLLLQAHRCDGEVIRHLPTRATAEGLGPAVIDGRPAYQSAGVRFRLAEDRVRELLMGEQLYGDPKLAVRELYQNALDACRYREARTEYLRRGQGRDLSWAGHIWFDQGIDAQGRPYLDCGDNGIGMGIRELTEVFSQAGVRLSDLPEFIEEQADWSLLDPPVRLYPNSRFGIGVLSYFMLADEITVKTCRLGRDGIPGQRLSVSIAGPGSLFRIQFIDPEPGTPSQDAGTTVRLHLRDGDDSVNCVRVLRELLRAADFHTEAASGSERHTWVPGQLSDARIPGESEEDSVRWQTAAVATPGGRVWWCPGQGAVLADGLWVGEKIFGAVVNLSRDLAPRLSVDRTRILGYRQEDVDRLLWEGVGALVQRGDKILDYDWLYSLARHRPLVADMVFEQAIAAGSGKRKWATAAGCFAQDNVALQSPDELMAWRLTALASAGRFRKTLQSAPGWERAVRARPSDVLIMSLEIDGTAPWLDPVSVVPLAHLVRAAKRIGREPVEVAARLEVLGYNPAEGSDRIGIDSDDVVLTSRDLDGERPWLPIDEPVSVLHLLRVADKTGRSLSDIVARLRLLGHEVEVDPHRLPVDRLEPDDTVITSRDLDGRNPWLYPHEDVAVLHVLRAGRHVMRPPAEVGARLAALGYQLAPGCAALSDTGEELMLVSRDLDSESPWIATTEPISPHHLLRAAEKTGQSVDQIVVTLTAMGYLMAIDEAGIATLAATAREGFERQGSVFEPDDMVIFSKDLDGKPPWLAADQVVSLVHVMRVAKELGRPAVEIRDRLVACGYKAEIDFDSLLVDELEPDDLVLVSVDLDGEAPWLNPTETVPLFHLMQAARRTRREVHDVAARLAVLGYGVTLECGTVSPDELNDDDLMLASRDLDSQSPWVDEGETIGLGHVVLAAGRTRKTIAEVVTRLESLGYQVDPAIVVLMSESVQPDDMTLISEDLDGKKPWLNPTLPVPLSHLFHAAKRVRRPMAEIAARMTALGYRVPDLETVLPRWRPGGV